MSRKFIIGVLVAAATVATMSSAPAQAGNDDLKRFLGVAATAAAVGLIINEIAKDDNVIKAHGWKGHGHHGYGKKPKLPRECLRKVGKYNHKRWVLGARCTWNHYKAPHLLPNKCLTKVKFKGGARYAYGLGCLKKQGFRLRKH